MRHTISHKARIKRALIRRGGITNYTPTEQVAKTWFRILNRSLFEDKLKPVDIVVRRLRGCIGQLHMDWDGRYSQKGTCDQSKLPYHNPTFGYKIELHNRFKTWKDFLETLAHEMVHQYQVEIQKDPHANHNCNFYAWREKFARYGMKLTL